MTMLSEYQLRRKIVRVMRILANQGLIRSSDGNLSVRLDESHFMITPSGLYKMAMEPDDPIVINKKGEVIVGKMGLKPTVEINMHLEVFHQRPEVNAVLHAHPPYATALTIAGFPFPTDYLPEVLIALGDVPVAKYGTPGTPALVESIQELIKDHNAIILSHHGSITVGESLEEALIAQERLEHAAYTYYLAHNLSEPAPLAEEELKRLRDIGNRTRNK